MPTARYDLVAVAVNNKVYAIGGHNGSSPLNTVEQFGLDLTVYVHVKN